MKIIIINNNKIIILIIEGRKSYFIPEFNIHLFEVINYAAAFKNLKRHEKIRDANGVFQLN